MNNEQVFQLPLNVWLKEGPSFTNFLCGPNSEACKVLKGVAGGEGERVVYLWGDSGTGKTHLLHACCRGSAERGGRVMYLPLRELKSLDSSLLGGLARLTLICLDDIDAIGGHHPWEEAIFCLYNQSELTGCRLLVAASKVPAESGLLLPDLISRLTTGLVLHLRLLEEKHRYHALQYRARELGFQVPDNVIAFLIRRYRRDMHSLFSLLDRLDRSTLSAKRRVTIPFIKDLLEK